MSELAELDFEDLDKFSQKIYKMLWQHPKEARKFMNKEGSLLRKTVLRQYKKLTKRKTGNLWNGVKKGRPYVYAPTNAFTIRVYNKAQHAHLIEYGYTRGKAEHLIKGKNVLGISEKMFEANFTKQAERYVDKLLEKGFG